MKDNYNNRFNNSARAWHFCCRRRRTEKGAYAATTSMKMNLCPFKLYRAHLNLLNLSNVGEFSRSGILQGLYPGSKRERKIRRQMLTSSVKRRIGRFDIVVVQWTWKKCTKKRDARAELLFCSYNQLFSRCCRRRGSLSSLMLSSD